jgi:hypothetical protein
MHVELSWIFWNVHHTDEGIVRLTNTIGMRWDGLRSSNAKMRTAGADDEKLQIGRKRRF